MEEAGVGGFDEDALKVRMDARLDHVIELEDSGGHFRGLVAADDNLVGAIGDFFANSTDGTFSHNIAIGEKDDLIGDHIDFVEDVARYDDVSSSFGLLTEEGNGF